MKRRGSRDHNHKLLSDHFEALGCSVTDLALAGVNGLPDIAVGCMGRTYLVELKNPDTAYGRKGMNTDQQRFAERWRGGQVYCVSTIEEVEILVANWRRYGVS